MAGVELDTFRLRQVRADAGVADAGLDEPGDVLVAEPILHRLKAVARHRDEDRAEVDASVMQPLVQGMDRAALLAGAAADLDLAPAGLAAQND
jgi:hypothetical protein